MCLNPLLWEGFLIFFNIKWNLFLSFICLFPLSFFRPGDSTETREREDPGLHSVSPCAGTPCGLLWRPLHRQTSLRVRRHHCFQRQLPWPSQWEARVEEIHWWASTDVLLCKRQVSNSCQRRTNYIGVKRKLQIPLEFLLQEIAKRRRLRRLCCYELTIQIKNLRTSYVLCLQTLSFPHCWSFDLYSFSSLLLHWSNPFCTHKNNSSSVVGLRFLTAEHPWWSLYWWLLSHQWSERMEFKVAEVEV